MATAEGARAGADACAQALPDPRRAADRGRRERGAERADRVALHARRGRGPARGGAAGRGPVAWSSTRSAPASCCRS